MWLMSLRITWAKGTLLLHTFIQLHILKSSKPGFGKQNFNACMGIEPGDST